MYWVLTRYTLHDHSTFTCSHNLQQNHLFFLLHHWLETVCMWGIAIWLPSGAVILNFSTATRAALVSEPRFPVVKDWRLFKNREWKEIFRPKKNDVTGDWRKLHNEEFHDLCFSPKWGWSNQEEQDGWTLSHVWGRREVCTRVWWGNLREIDYF
jgi:hypothetical protein